MTRPLALVAMLVLTAAGAACTDSTGPGCATSADMLYNDVPTSLNDGSPVATFHFSQRYQSSFDAECVQQGGPIRLMVTSNAPITQTFSYVARGIGPQGSVDWTIAGTIQALPPGATEDEGEVIYTTLPVDQGIRIDFSSWSSP